MGTHPALKLCYGLLVLLALSHAAATEGEEDVGLLPDEICPCIVREECPRVFGTLPEDGLLGSFPPCEDPDSVRCCGVSSRVSVAHSVSSSGPKSGFYGAGGSEKNRKNVGTEKSVRLIPAGIVVPVPLSFPEYVDPRTTTELPRRRIVEVESYDDVYEDESGSDERITDVEKYVRGDELTAEERERELNSGATLRGENIDDHTALQTDASLSPDYLDYRGVNKHRIKGGTTQTNMGSRQRGEISSSKRVESTSSSSSTSATSSSSSSSDIKSESIVATRDNGSSNFDSTSETRPKLLEKEEEEEEEAQFDTPEIIEQKVTSSDVIDSSISQRGRNEAENNSEFTRGRFGVSSQNSIVPVDGDLVGVDESGERIKGFVSQPVQNQRNFVGDTSPGLGNHRFNQFRPDFRGQTVFRNHESSSQQNNEKVNKESSNFEENSSSSFALIDERREDVGTSRRPTTRNQRMETELHSGGQTIYGSRSQVSNQTKQESAARESANLEQNSFSSVGGVTSITEQLQDVGTNANIARRWRWPGPTIHAPRPNLGREFAALESEDRTVYGQQTETSPQRNSQSEKKESSKSEENASSDVRTINTNTGIQSADDLSSQHLETSFTPVAGIRNGPTINRGSIIHQRRQQISSRREAQSGEKKSSNFEETTSSNVRSATTSIGGLSDDDSSAKLIDTSLSSGAEIRRPTLNTGRTFYRHRQQAASQKNAQSEKKESANFEENKSSNAQTSTGNTGEVLADNLSSKVVETSSSSVPEIRRPTAHRFNTFYEQRQRATSQNEAQSEKKESSNFEENKSSNAQTSTGNTGGVLADNLSSQVVETSSSSVPEIRRPTAHRFNTFYEQRQQATSQNEAQSEKKESANFEENKSSNAQTSTGDTGEVLADDLTSKLVETSLSSVPEIRRPTSYRINTFYKQQQQATSQETAANEKEESTNLEENTSSDIQSKTTNTREPPQHDASLISQPAYEQQKESSMQQKSESVQTESSNLEKNASSDVETSSLNTEELSHNDNMNSDHLGTISVDKPIYLQRGETTSTQTKSEMTSKESSSREENTSSNVIKVDTIGEIPSGFKISGGMNEESNQQITLRSKDNAVYEQRPGTSTNEKTESTSIGSSSMMENISTTSNPMNLVTGKTSSVADGSSKSTEIENRSENAWVWHVANRAYVPVLINAGFLRDRPTTTGPVGLDPLSGVTHTDVLDPDLAPELLPLFCGNVVFGERSEARQTLVCDIPSNMSPIRFLAGDQKAVNPEKVPSPILPNTVLPGEGQQRLETDNVERSGSVEIKEDATNSQTKNTRVENSMMMNSMTSESRSEESSKTTTIDAINNNRQNYPRRRVIVRRPMQIPAVEERHEEEAVILPTPTKEVFRGRNRHVTDRIESRPAVDSQINTVLKNQGETGSRQVSRGSVSMSSRSFKKATSSQESMSSNSNQETATAEFDVSLTDGDNKQRQTERKNSRFYVAPEKIVEATDVVPSANSRISKKRFRNLPSTQKVSPQNLEVPSMKTFEENDANVKEAEFVHPEERDWKRPGFFYRRKSRRANSFAPEVETMTISPDELSMTGRVNVVGPIPAGFEDPALATKEEIPMELPKKIGLYALKSAANSRQQVVARNTEPFKPSPIDPLHH